MKTRITLKNGTIVLFDRIIKGDIEIENGIITAIGKKDTHKSDGQEVDATGKYILPGFCGHSHARD